MKREGRNSVLLQCLLLQMAFDHLAGQASSRPEGQCQVVRSATGAMEFSCLCDQSMPQIEGEVAKMILNYTDCVPYTNADVSWGDLEASVTVSDVMFVGAEITFKSSLAMQRLSSITSVQFIHCSFNEIPMDAFALLYSLREVTFINNFIRSINRNAFSNMESLKKLNFAHSRIDGIQYDAFNELPNVDGITFDTCNITEIASSAFRLFQSRQLECPFAAENDTISSVNYEMMEYFMNPKVTKLSPFKDPIFMFFKSNITTIQTAAIQTNQFSYVVFKENTIVTFGEEAFLSVQLGNNCNNRLLLFKNNTIDTLKTDAIAFVSAEISTTYKTFFVIEDNTFGTVEKRAFRINPGFTLASVRNNNFVCKCNNTNWYIDASYTNPTEEGTRQKELEDSLVSTGHCYSENTNLYFFLSYCLSDHRDTENSSSTKSSVNYIYYFLILVGYLKHNKVF